MTDPHQPVTEPPAGPDRRFLLAGAACAAAALGVLFNSAFVQLRATVTESPPADNDHFDQLNSYTMPTAMVVALLVLRQFPRRGWAWLLAAGSVLALPVPVGLVDEDLVNGLPEDVLTVMVIASSSLVLLGALGAAAWIWTAAAGAGAGLAGTATAMPLVGIIVIFTGYFGRDPAGLRFLLIVLGGLGLLGAVGAVVVVTVTGARPGPLRRPSWRATVYGVLAAPVLTVQLFIDRVEPADRYFLALGIAIAVPGLVLALLAGPRIGLATLVAAMLGIALAFAAIGVTTALGATPALTLPAVFAGAVLGWLLGAGRWRVWFAAAGLAICGIALLAAPDLIGLRLSGGATTLGVALLMVGIAAVVSASATTATVLADASGIPATFGSLVVVVQYGSGPLLTYLITRQDGRASPTAVVGVVVLAAVVAVAGIGWWQWTRARAAAGPALDADAVWHQLPPEDADR